MVDSAHLETDQEFLFNPITDQRAILTEVTLTPTQLCYEIETVGKMKQETGWDAMNGRFVLKMKRRVPDHLGAAGYYWRYTLRLGK